MMSKTHVTVGMAASLLAFQPTTIVGCTLAIAGGALGGVIADCDTITNDYKHDALIGELIAAGIVVVMVVLNYIFGGDVVLKLSTHNKTSLIAGLVAFVVLYIVGFISNHRQFTHSLLAMILFGSAIALIYNPVAKYFLVGYLSHLIIDMLNKKGIQILFPLKPKVCLGLFYADDIENEILMYAGLISSVIMVFLLVTKGQKLF